MKMRDHLRHLPIRWRLTLGFALVAAAAFALIGLALYQRTKAHVERTLDAALREEVAELVPLLTGPGDMADLLPLDDDDERLVFHFQVYDSADGLVGASPEARAVDLRPADWPETAGDPVTTESVGLGELRVLVLETVVRDDDRVLVAATPTAPNTATLASVRLRLVGWSALGLAVAAVAAHLLAGAALRPVEQMRRRAAEITAAHPERRLPLPPANDEIRRLGETLNASLDELEAAGARRRLFLAHASHELRTPLTRLRARLELARAPTVGRAELEETVHEAAIDTEELIVLADALLDLSAIESGPEARPRTTMATVLRAVNPTDEIHLAVRGDAETVTVPLETERAVRNLLANAALHGRPPIDLEVEVGSDTVVLTVWDRGAGMTAEVEATAFEAFTRAPNARDRPGSGLGLAIVAAVARRADGTVSVVRDEARFGVRLELPARRASPPGPPSGARSGGTTRPRPPVKGSGLPVD